MAITDVQLLFDKNPNPMLIHELDTQQVINANQAALTLYGYTRDEMKSLTITDLELEEEDPVIDLGPDTDPDHAPSVQRHRNKQGETLYVNTFFNPIKTDGKNCKLVVVQDITSRIVSERKNEKAQKVLDVLIRQLPGTFFIIDAEAKMHQWNDYLETMTGYTGEEVANMHGLSFFSPDDQPALLEALQEVIEEGETEVKAKVISKSGTSFPFLMKASKTMIDGEFYIVGIGIDVSSLEKVQEQLERSNKKLKEAQDIAKMGYWTHNLKKDSSNWSDGVYKIYGLDPEVHTLSYQKWLDTIHPEDRDQYIIDADTAFPDGNFYDIEHRIITPDGQVKWVMERVILHRDEDGNAAWLEGITQDITEKKEKEEKVREALEEKETLLMEIHHRVKNNLAIISGLFDLEVFESDDEVLKGKLRDSQGRVNSIALTHEILYQQRNFSNIDFDKNVKQLVERIMSIYQQEVQVDYDVEPVSLNINQALPCSLMVNEIVTNALKHAFDDDRNGVIKIALKESDGEVYLQVSDNGKGMEEDVDLESAPSLGLHLIQILKEQLRAELKVSASNGTSYKIRFKKENRKGVGSSLSNYS